MRGIVCYLHFACFSSQTILASFELAGWVSVTCRYVLLHSFLCCWHSADDPTPELTFHCVTGVVSHQK